ncbi:MAG: NAD(P)H-binding protein [Methyloceanibacter sp.]
MAHVLIVGASKGIGFEALRQAIAVGHQVKAFSRSANRIDVFDANLEKRRGDALSEADIDAALGDIDGHLEQYPLASPAQIRFGDPAR